MKKLRKLIDVLSEEDIEAIRSSFYRDSDKIAKLFGLLVEGKDTNEVKTSLNLTKNAFTTLGSRLHSKIKNHLVEIKDSPKADVLRKLRNIDDILFVEEPQIALATLKKLEYELKKYDLSNELTIVYRHLKRFYVNQPEYFTYSKLYNRHIAYSLALDKAEEILGNYFKEYGFFYVMKDEKRRVKLNALFEEMLNVCALYKSHRMQVYLGAMEISHRLYVDPAAYKLYKRKSLEDIFIEVNNIFVKYPRDSFYVHLKLIFKVLHFQYYYSHGILDKPEELIKELRPNMTQLLVHYENYGFPAQLLDGLVHFELNENESKMMHPLPVGMALDYVSEPSLVMIYIYQSCCQFYNNQLAESSKWLFELSNRISFKDFPVLFTEVKCLISLVKYGQQDSILFIQNFAAAQRLLRRLDKDSNPGLVAMVKYLGVLAGKKETGRGVRLTNLIRTLESTEQRLYCPIGYFIPGLKKMAAGFI